MLNAIWLGMIIIAIVVGAITGHTPQVVASVTTNAKLAFTIALGLAGIMAFWLGLMKIAEVGGIIQIIARLARPIMVRLFPDVPADHPAMGTMMLNMAANFLGLNNAATPFGLRAMKDLEALNEYPGVASNAMCTFLAINTSSVALIPTTAIAFLAAGGASDPTAIILTSIIATSCSTATGIVAAKSLQRWRIFRIRPFSSSVPLLLNKPSEQMVADVNPAQEK